MFLSIKNLTVSVEEKNILKNFSIEINKGEIHSLMGPNGSGKSTLANVLAGKEDYRIESGEIIFKEQNLFNLNIEERAQLGLFLAFQYPVEIPGVSITPFLKSSISSKLKTNGKDEIDHLEFAKILREKANNLGINSDMLKRALNVGFSGGEKKRYEILQMSILEPDLAILDETDSGLDIDALKIVTEGINNLKNKNNSFLIIKAGELHAIMGPNGSGKSTLANVLSGKNGYEISGELNFNGENLKKISIEERAQKGIFLAFQYPLEIPGVNTNNFLKTSLNSIRKSKGEKELDTLAFLKLVKEKTLELGIDENIL